MTKDVEAINNRDARNVFIIIAIVVQALCVLILLFGDIGFDHPGKYGLDFGHTLILMLTYCLALLIVSILAATQRRWKLVLAEVVSPVAFYLILSAVFELHSYWTRLAAQDFQHLKGMTVQEVHHVLQDTPHAMGGSTHPEGEYAEDFHGITVVFDSQDGHVTAIHSNIR